MQPLLVGMSCNDKLGNPAKSLFPTGLTVNYVGMPIDIDRPFAPNLNDKRGKNKDHDRESPVISTDL